MHKHRSWFDTALRSWTGCVIPYCNEPRAHGGVTWTEYCRCGAHRHVEASAGWRNYGPWIGGDEEEPDPIQRAADAIGAIRRGRYWIYPRGDQWYRITTTELRVLARKMMTNKDAVHLRY